MTTRTITLPVNAETPALALSMAVRECRQRAPRTWRMADDIPTVTGPWPVFAWDQCAISQSAPILQGYRVTIGFYVD